MRPRRPTITSGPGYPSALVDDVLAWSATPRGGRALEVGPGTGKATTLFAARGLEIICLELSLHMANVARRNFAPYAAVKVIDAKFEEWPAGHPRFDLLLSAQAWYSVREDVGYVKPHEVLVPETPSPFLESSAMERLRASASTRPDITSNAPRS